jgi:hypothetical protein
MQDLHAHYIQLQHIHEEYYEETTVSASKYLKINYKEKE